MTIQLFESIPQIAEDRCEDLTGNLSIGIIPTLSQYLLPLFLKDFLERFPGLHLQIKDIKEFRLDCGILALPIGKEGLVEKKCSMRSFWHTFPLE